MKQDEIIEMARQARLPYYYQDGAIVNLERLEVFAKLVAAKEREACAKTVEKIETYEKIEKACFKFAAKTIRARSGDTK